MATWNVRGLNGKEKELEQDFEKLKISILGITETKRKEKGEYKTENGHLCIYSGLEQKERAAGGVACMINKNIMNNIEEYRCISHRLLLIKMQANTANNYLRNIIVVYAPTNDSKKEEKDIFWNELNKITEELDGETIVMGDLNARVGIKDEIYKENIGKFGEITRNDNGKRLLEYSIMNNFIITNTFFKHKDIHTYTRESHSRGERSIIDYILVAKNRKNTIKDIKVMRGPEIGSDHYLLLLKTKNIKQNNTTKATNQNDTKYEKIRTYKLNDSEIAEQYKQQLKTKWKALQEEQDIETVWTNFEKTLLQTTREVCGSYTRNRNKKQTMWWSHEIKKEIEAKKKYWKQYLNNKTNENYITYKKSRKIVKEMIQKEKRKMWDNFGNKMEKNSKINQKLFYGALKTLREDNKDRNTNLKIKDKNNKILIKNEDINKRWREYFVQLFNNTNKHMTPEEKQVEVNNTTTEEDITMNEMTQTIKKMKNGKSAGKDKLVPEMFKNLDQDGMKILLKIINRVWKEEQIPTKWCETMIVPIHKNGDRLECSNYRGINLINTIIKILEGIIENRIRTKTEHLLEDQQCAFRKGRSIQDHIFTTKQLIEKMHSQQRQLFLAFIDLEKAFDRINRNEIWRILDKYKINHKIIRITRNIYNNTKNIVITNGITSEPFQTSEGLRQGGGLSPLLFILFMNEILKKCNKETKKLNVGYNRLEMTYITEGLFADDIVLYAENEKNLQHNITVWKKHLERAGMKINEKKTKIMVIGDHNTNIKIDNEKLEQVKVYKYLGVKIEENGKMEAEINTRIQNTIKLFHSMRQNFLKNKEISTPTKIKIFKTIYRPVLTFSCESWTLNRTEKSRIQAVEMKYLRAVRGVTRMDRQRNEKIREELKIESVLEYIEKKQLCWWGHLQRMSNKRQTKKIWEAKNAQKRRPGRPKETWNNIISKSLQKNGLSFKEAKEIAKNKKEWRYIVYGNNRLDK